MNKISLTVVIALILINTTSYSQKVSLPDDSISSLLCKKWEVDYALMGTMKIGMIPGATEMKYEFFKDKTFLLTSNDPDENTKGTWVYDPKKKLIKLTVTGGSNSNIISLKEDEFVMIVDTKDAGPDKSMELKVVFKIRKK